MLSRICKSWLLVLGITLATHGYAATDFYPRFKQLNRQDGLSQAYVLAIAQDQQGFLWFGTQGGLNRYDGREFLHFFHDDGPGSIAGSEIKDIEIDASGNIWVATNTGLSMLDGVSYEATNFFHEPDNPRSLSSSETRALLIDDDGSVWVGTALGLDQIDPATLEVVRHSLRGDERVVRVNDLDSDANGRLWVASSRGLYGRTEGGSFERVLYRRAPDWRNIPFNDIDSLLVDSRGDIWVGASKESRGNSKHGVVRWAPSTNTTHVISSSSEPGKNLVADTAILAMYEDSDGYVWIGQNNGGANRYHPDNANVDHIRPEPLDSASLANPNVESLFEDLNGVMWIGTSGGASYFSLSSADVKWFSRDSTERPPTDRRDYMLTGSRISGFAELGSGEIAITTLDAGLNILNPVTREIRSLDQNYPALPDLSSYQLSAALVDQSGLLWVATYGSGLNRVDLDAGTVRVFTSTDDPRTLPANGVSSLLEDREGNLWVGTVGPGGGLGLFQSEENSFQRWGHIEEDENSLSSERVLAVFRDSIGFIWVGHYGYGLDRLNPDTGVVNRVSADTPLEHAIVSAIHEDNRGDLWIATQQNGLWRWQYDDRRAGNARFEQFTERDGLADLTTYAAVADAEGRLWLASGVGLTRVDAEFATFENFDTSHGVLHKEFNFGAAFRASDGRLYFGSDGGGFNAFYPEDMKANERPPAIAVSGIEIVDQQAPRSLVNSPQEVIELSHRQYAISFNVKALDFAAPEKHQYAFQLEGLDETWQDAGNSPVATYTNLAPGEYVFRAKAINNSGVGSVRQVVRTIRVLPPPWRTPQAYALYALLAFILGWIVLRTHTARLRERAAHAYADELSTMNSALNTEVAQRREKEILLSQEKERAETYFNVAEVVLLTLDAECRVVRINQKGCELLGGGEAELTGQSWFNYVADDWRTTVEYEMKALVAGEGEFAGDYFEFPVTGSRDNNFLVAWKCKRIVLDDGTVGIFCSGMDVTKVRTLEKQVRLKEKMNAIGTLAGGIAHDFNNILQAIYGFTTLALERVSPGDEKAIYLQQVVKGADRARHLVKRILTFSNQQEYDLESVDLDPVVREAVALLRGSLPATVEIVLDIDEDRSPVRADPTRIHQIVMNLGTNAGQAMRIRGGQLQVALKRTRFEPEDLPNGSRLRPGYHMHLSVKDSGVGMTQDTLDHIFDPFFTTKDENENTGLGLTVVHGIVQSHGGQIEVESSPGQGTQFDLYFPVSEEPVAATPLPRQTPQTGSERLLIVDDEAWVLTVTRDMLVAKGYKVEAVASGMEALDLMRTQPGGFHMLITDETMPKMTGTDLVTQARELQPTLPVLVISGKLAPQSIELERTWFLQKPFTADELTGRVRQVLDEVATATASESRSAS